MIRISVRLGPPDIRISDSNARRHQCPLKQKARCQEGYQPDQRLYNGSDWQRIVRVQVCQELGDRRVSCESSDDTVQRKRRLLPKCLRRSAPMAKKDMSKDRMKKDDMKK